MDSNLRPCHQWGALAITVLLLANVTVTAQEPDYKPLARSSGPTELFRIEFDKNTLAVSLTEGERPLQETYQVRDIQVKNDGTVTVAGATLFDRDGLILDNVRRSYTSIHDLRMSRTNERTSVTFLGYPEGSPQAERRLRGNRITFNEAIVVGESDFVRGLVFTVSGDVEIYGEVNADVVSLFGDVYVGPEAVARGDVATIKGRIDVAKDASVYGGTYSGQRARQKYHRRWVERRNGVSDQFAASYDRVDGLYLQEGIRYDDGDSILPSAWINGGYAFASERWRFQLGLEQTLLRRFPLTLGGTYGRQLRSEDDWLIGDAENSAMALIAKEDYRDYYESEAGTIQLTARPARNLVAKLGMGHEETHWLKAHRNLWSLFGGDKKFRPNFSTVDSAFRETGIADLESRDNAALFAELEFDSRRHDDVFSASAWYLTSSIEWSSPDWKSDYDYRRYSVILRRYQQLHSRVMLLLRAAYGGSDGELPMHKRFFLGGLGTLRGFDHKEYLGTQYWMANAEYRVAFPRTDLAASLFWDLGQIANGPLDENAEVKHAVGVGLSVGQDFRVDVGKRLDGQGDDFEIYVRLEHVF